jgi:hypothetical protein
MLDALFTEWVERCAKVAVGVETGGASLTVQYVVETDRERLEHFQVFDDGRLAVWEPGVASEHAFALVHEPADAVAFVTGGLTGNDALERTWVEEPRAEGAPRRLRPPPLDERDIDWSNLAPVPDATVLQQNTLIRSPFGTVAYYGGFVDGRRGEWSLGRHPAPDTTVEMIYALRLRAQAGLISTTDQLEGGAVTGDWSMLMLLAGIIESPEYLDALAQGSGVRAQLGDFAEIVDSQPYRDAQAEIAQLVPAPV